MRNAHRNYISHPLPTRGSRHIFWGSTVKWIHNSQHLRHDIICNTKENYIITVTHSWFFFFRKSQHGKIRFAGEWWWAANIIILFSTFRTSNQLWIPSSSLIWTAFLFFDLGYEYIESILVIDFEPLDNTTKVHLLGIALSSQRKSQSWGSANDRNFVFY